MSLHWLSSRINAAVPGDTWACSEQAVPGAAKASIAAECVYCGCFAAFVCPDSFTWLFFSKISVLYPVCHVRLCALALILTSSGKNISPRITFPFFRAKSAEFCISFVFLRTSNLCRTSSVIVQSYLLLHHVQSFFPQGGQLYLLNELSLFVLPCISRRQQVRWMVKRAKTKKKVKRGNGETGKSLEKERNFHRGR